MCRQAKYDDVFSKLQVAPDGTISGKQARQVLVNSKLKNQILGQIWELSDITKDGKLDADEFAVVSTTAAMCCPSLACFTCAVLFALGSFCTCSG